MRGGRNERKKNIRERIGRVVEGRRKQCSGKCNAIKKMNTT